VIEMRQKESIFQPALQKESNSAERMKYLKEIEKISKQVNHNRDVKIIKCWHGTTIQKANKILDFGFANLATLDEGWFGKGIYFSSFPEYSLSYCKDKSDPCLILCYVILSNPYPIIYDDAPTKTTLFHLGKGNYRTYGSHYVPIVHYGGVDFRPPRIGENHKFDEVVIFQESHILPKFLVHFAPNPQIQSISNSNLNSKKNVSTWNIDEVVTWMEKLELSKSYEELIRSNNVIGKVLKTMKSKEDWKELGVSLFGDLRILSSSTEKLFK